MRVQLRHSYQDSISLENLLDAWKEFVLGKRGKRDVQEFSLHLMDNLLALHRDLVSGAYRHGGYHQFSICDPKARTIHKAPVRDRVLHHAIYRTLYPYFDTTFIADSFSCRLDKGTHRALNRFRAFGYRVSQNHTRTTWVLKFDIKKFFASIDQKILIGILVRFIPDSNVMNLLQEIIGSFSSTAQGVGLPLGNLTSQLFSNVYMNEFDQFVKHSLRAKHYIRYADDFVFFSPDRNYLLALIPKISAFLETRLHLLLHPQKIFIKTLASGVDFLGWVHFPNHRVLRTATKRRMFRRLREHGTPETAQSYIGLLRHGNTFELRKNVWNAI